MGRRITAIGVQMRRLGLVRARKGKGRRGGWAGGVGMGETGGKRRGIRRSSVYMLYALALDSCVFISLWLGFLRRFSSPPPHSNEEERRTTTEESQALLSVLKAGGPRNLFTSFFFNNLFFWISKGNRGVRRGRGKQLFLFLLCVFYLLYWDDWYLL